MNERPILFNAPMVRALLAGTKTQTRRLAKGVVARHAVTGEALATLNSVGPRVTCPYGQPGDRLWVRETWMDLRGTGVEHRPDPRGALQRYAYAADCPPGSHGNEARKDYGLKWRPSIHMPRTASRITLEVTGVRLERLQDISAADAKAEGCDHRDPCDHIRHACSDIGCQGPDYRVGYRELWEQINGPGSWAANPWVWVVEFKRLDKAGAP